MVFSGVEIKGAIHNGAFAVESACALDVRSASICLHLSSSIIVPVSSNKEVDVRKFESYPQALNTEIDSVSGLLMQPGSFILGATVEKIALSNNVAGFISNISGLARLGLNSVLSTYVSPGFGEGKTRPLTLELHNASGNAIRIFPGMRICHLLLFRLGEPAELGYDQMNPCKYLVNSPQGSEFYKDTGIADV